MNEMQIVRFRNRIENEILDGICERCRRTIPEKRLELNPVASHCIECQEKMELNAGLSRRRPRTVQ